MAVIGLGMMLRCFVVEAARASMMWSKPNNDRAGIVNFQKGELANQLLHVLGASAKKKVGRSADWMICTFGVLLFDATNCQSSSKEWYSILRESFPL